MVNEMNEEKAFDDSDGVGDGGWLWSDDSVVDHNNTSGIYNNDMLVSSMEEWNKERKWINYTFEWNKWNDRFNNHHRSCYHHHHHRHNQYYWNSTRSMALWNSSMAFQITLLFSMIESKIRRTRKWEDDDYDDDEAE